ncbi:MAG: DNA mismatch repair protein MutS [Bacteroidetes bacterium]|nr:DNA mismatch repair protein MutS [Bacteroidota bacterium]
MRIYPEDSRQSFEFDKVCQHTEQFCRSAGGRERVRNLEPISDIEKIRLLLMRVQEYLDVTNSGGGFPAASYPEIAKELSLLSVSGSTLQEKQLLNIRDVSDTVNNLLKFLEKKEVVLPGICSIFNEVYQTREIIDPIDRVLDTAGIVRSSASKALLEIRNELAHARKELDKVFRQQLAKLRKLGWLADTEESIYHGRRVLAVLSEQKRTVKGLIQGSSDTGKTTFIEPLETVDLNNEVFELISKERREIMRILNQLTAELRHFLPLIKKYDDVLSEFDFNRAKALFAREINACMPHLIKGSQLRLVGARHPLLFLHHKNLGKSVVPMNCELNHEQRLLVISGPNAGGKSITLKTVGLLQMMLQSGMLIPAEPESEVGVFHRLFADIGDNQSIEMELSTYSSRLARMRHFLEMADKRTLVLIDEFGTGTDPELGGAVAEAMLEELARRKTLGVITTHYMNIKIAAERLQGVNNACMLFDDQSLQPLFQLIIGQPGSSYTYIIAEKAGLPQALINRARNMTSKDKVTLDKMLQQLQKDKQELTKLFRNLDEKQAAADAAKIKYEELFEKWKKKTESKKFLADDNIKFIEIGKKFLDIQQEWEKAKDKKPVTAKLNRMLNAEKKKKLDKKASEKKAKIREKVLERKKEEIKVGSKVRLLNGKQTGVVEEIQNNRARVVFGNLKTLASLENLEVVDV